NWSSSVDPVIDHAPADRLFDQDDALGGWVLAFEIGFEKNTLVLAFRRAHEFFHVRGPDKLSIDRFTERCPPRLHQPNELVLCPGLNSRSASDRKSLPRTRELSRISPLHQ